MVVTHFIERNRLRMITSSHSMDERDLGPHNKCATNRTVDWRRALDSCPVLQTIE